MAERGIGDNSPPAITSDEKVRLIAAIVRSKAMTAPQKCIAIGIVVSADEEGVTKARTGDLHDFSNLKDRGTLFEATKVLRDKNIIQMESTSGQSGRYKVVPERVMEAIEKAYANLKTGQVEAYRSEKTSMEKPVGKNHTGREKAIGSEPTGEEKPVGKNHTGASATQEPYKESPNGDSYSKKKSAASPSSDPVVVNCETIAGPGFVISLGAVSMEANLRGLSRDFAVRKAEAMARQWAASGKPPQNPDATIARALREEANDRAVQDARRGGKGPAQGQRSPSEERDRKIMGDAAYERWVASRGAGNA